MAVLRLHGAEIIPQADDLVLLSASVVPLSIPPEYAVVVSGGIAHLVVRGASGPPYLTVCQQSVAAPLTDPPALMVPCPRCSAGRREPRRWRGWESR